MAQPWYKDGLQFTCSQCGNCCTGGPGFVWISEQEVARLAAFLGITPEETVEKYCRDVGGRLSLKEFRNAAGNYDCVFLKEEKIAAAGGFIQTRRRCTVYEVRPLQCRTWPFWPENLWSRKTWDHAARRCHGMNAGKRHYTKVDLRNDLATLLGKFVIRGGLGLRSVDASHLRKGPISQARHRDDIIAELFGHVIGSHEISGLPEGGVHIVDAAEDAVKFFASNNNLTGPIQVDFDRLVAKLKL